MPQHKPIPSLFLVFLLCFCYSLAQGQVRQIEAELQRLPTVKDSVNLVNSLNRLGTLYRNRNADSSFYYGMKAKQLATRLHDEHGQTAADHVIAYAFFKRGLYPEALESLGKVLPYYQKKDDTEKIIRVYLDMADVLNKGIDKPKGISLLQEAMQLGKQLKKDSVLSEVYMVYYIRNPNLPKDSVDYYLNQSKAIASRYKDEYMLNYNLMLQASRLISNDQRQEALPLIEQLKSAAQQMGNAIMEVNLLFQMVAYDEGEPKKMLEHLYQAYAVTQKSGDQYLKIYILNNALEVAKQLGDKDEIIHVHDELEKAMTAEWENSRKFIGDYVVYNNIQANNKLLSKQNEQQTSYLIVIGVSLIIAVLALLKVWHNRKQLLNLNKMISTQNANMQVTLNALEESQADNTRMMQIVAHDLRNPIGGMFSIASMMLADARHTAEDKEYLELIKTSGKLSLDLVSDLLLVHAKTDELKKEAVNLGHLLHNCVNLLRHKALLKDQQIALEANDVVRILANQEKLWRVVSNLIGNAIKFSPKGATIAVSLQKTADHVRIAVKDDGIGIPDEIAAKIFDMFTDAKRTGTAGEQSFGLGLAISKQIVEAHGGKLWFESKAGQGTVFFVELPVA